jgi:hypothetical protein
LSAMGLAHDPRRQSAADNDEAGDRNSIQVTHWRARAASRDVRFIDGLAPFSASRPAGRFRGTSLPAPCISALPAIDCSTRRCAMRSATIIEAARNHCQTATNAGRLR